MAEEEQVTSPAEETTETTEAQDTETSEEQESSDAADTDASKDWKKIAEDQRKRAEKAEGELKKSKPQVQNPRALSSEDRKRLDRIELNSVGIKDRDEQDFVLSAAKRLGVDPSEAVTDPIITARLERMREVKASKDATPSPTKGGSGPAKSSKLPDFSKMSDSEFDDWKRKNR